MLKLLKYLTVTLLLFYSITGNSQTLIPFPLTEDSEISLLTFSPGEELYSIFGHNAIRVRDPNLNLDIVFNYGTFDFATPNFYMKFIEGKLNYILSVSDFQSTLYEYMKANRWVFEQKMDITLDEKQFLLDSLRINALPENKTYLYDFFFDNCATRIRDVFYESLDGVKFDYTQIESGKNFRKLLEPYIHPFPWIELGINMALGVRGDRIATPWETMFLPDNMMEIFRYVRIERNNQSNLLFYPEKIIFEGKIPTETRLKLYDPAIIFWALFVLGAIITFIDLKRKKISLLLDKIIFGCSGLLGILLVFLWFGTDHEVMEQNYNLLWAMPLHFPAVFFLFRKRWAGFSRKYFFVTSVSLILIAVFWRLIPQELPAEIFPLILLLALRALFVTKVFELNKKD